MCVVIVVFIIFIAAEDQSYTLGRKRRRCMQTASFQQALVMYMSGEGYKVQPNAQWPVGLTSKLEGNPFDHGLKQV